MAVDKYQHLPADGQLRRASMDAMRIAALLTPSGYLQALPGLGEYSAVEHVRTKLSDWSKDVELGGDDTVVFYYAGHGLVQERDRHYLMCWSSREDDPDATALPTEDLVRILTRTGLRNLLVVLDTCYGGVGAADGVQLVLRTLARRFDHTGSSSGVWVLSSARSRDEAEDGAFVDCFEQGLADARARTGQRQRYLDLGYLVETVNRRFEQRQLRQRAELAAGVVTGVAPFLDNEAYNPDLPSGDTDLTLQRRLARGELHDHFGPRARGVEFDSEPGLYFSGRERVMSELVAWLTGADDDRGRAVTGKPGCGKSAVLGRIVAMSDPTYRQDLLKEKHPAAAEVMPRLVAVWVHARHKLLPEIVERIATDLSMAADSPGQLLRQINQHAAEHGSIVIVVDALDEAGAGAESGGKHEPRRIARELLRPLSEISGVRLLVGTRRELVSSLGADMVVLDLDEPRYLGDEDIAGYVTKVLLAENEPDVRSPYRGRPELARQVGEAVVRPCLRRLSRRPYDRARAA
ncbi:caspase family protein [Amycolatopsis sp. lyj-112]|uniref:caspase family protein n=1 Tax=Amycolatopsis sp. lyj-112 TaxID=2789288 RepID=UPI003979122C